MKNHALKQGELDVLSLDVPYVAAPTELYAAVCQDRPYSLLLESAEIDSKQDLKSLMLIDAAVRIVCRGRTVELEAKSKNGRNVLDAVEAELTRQALAVDKTRKTDLLTCILLRKTAFSTKTPVFASRRRLMRFAWCSTPSILTACQMKH